MFGYFRIRLVLTVTLCALAAFSIPAHADKVTASLAQASKLLEQGLPVKAVEVIDQTLKSGQIPSDLAAKALLMRAQAQEKIGKYAYALADYNQALWMEGLSSGDKSQAEEGRNRILSKLGVGEDSGKAASVSEQQPAPSKLAAQKRSASTSGDSPSSSSEVQTSPSEQRTGGIGSVFEGLFGSPESSSPVLSTRSEPAQRRATKPVAPPVKTAQAVQTATLSDQAADSGSDAPASQPTGDFAVQFAALHTEDKAVYEADRIAKRYREWLGGRTPSIMIRPTSEGDTLYKVIAEPYERGEGIATCELLKTKGISCMLISR